MLLTTFLFSMMASASNPAELRYEVVDRETGISEIGIRYGDIEVFRLATGFHPGCGEFPTISTVEVEGDKTHIFCGSRGHLTRMTLIDDLSQSEMYALDRYAYVDLLVPSVELYGGGRDRLVIPTHVGIGQEIYNSGLSVLGYRQSLLRADYVVPRNLRPSLVVTGVSRDPARIAPVIPVGTDLAGFKASGEQIAIACDMLDEEIAADPEVYGMAWRVQNLDMELLLRVEQDICGKGLRNAD